MVNLSIISSSSSGNGYVLRSDNEILLIEAGTSFFEVEKSCNFETNIIKGCLITHEHKDHSKYALKYVYRGINVYSSEGTLVSLGIKDMFGVVALNAKQPLHIGGFKVMAFDVKHDAAQPFGYLINHKDCGNILFLTDTYYSKYVFKNINIAIVEANYIEDIINEKYYSGELPKFRYDRVKTSHMGLKTCKDLLRANDLSNCRDIVLIHLSNHHSDANRIKKEISEEFNKRTWIADNGLNIDITNYDTAIHF